MSPTSVGVEFHKTLMMECKTTVFVFFFFENKKIKNKSKKLSTHTLSFSLSVCMYARASLSPSIDRQGHTHSTHNTIFNQLPIAQKENTDRERDERRIRKKKKKTILPQQLQLLFPNVINLIIERVLPGIKFDHFH